MKGLVAKAATAATLVGSLSSSGGCYHYQRVVDPCWPQRYNYTSRREVISAFAPQVQNGHTLDQTLFNYHFIEGSGELTDGGRDALDTIMRRRPAPDPRVFIATARDLGYDPKDPDKLVANRRELDDKRAASVQTYLAAQTAGRPVQWEIVVHDPMPVSDHADPVNRSIRLYHNASIGSLFGGSSATTASSTGASGGGAGGSTAGGGGGGGGGQQGGGGTQPAGQGSGQGTR